MVGRLSSTAARILGRSGLVRSTYSIQTHAGMGLPVGKHIVPNKPLPVNHKLVSDKGTTFPKPCVDPNFRMIGDTIRYEALTLLAKGLTFILIFGGIAAWDVKERKVNRNDNLRVEDGGEP